MGNLHDQESLALKDLIGYDVRLNRPGSAHYEGLLIATIPLVIQWDENPPAAGEYELSFRAPDTTAWHNDARIPTVTIE